jgi:methyl-accepting chemotaxis protein
MRTNWLRLESLRTQVALIAVIGTASLATVITVAFYLHLTGQLQRGLERKGESIARFAAANLVAFVEFDERAGAMEMVGKLTADPDIDYVLVLSPDGKTFGEAGAGAPDGLSRKHWFREEASFVEGQRLHVVWPVVRGGEVLGVVQIGLSLEEIAGSGRRVGWIAALAALGLTVLIAAFFTAAVNRAAVRPVVRMTRRLERLGDGDLRADVAGLEAGAAFELVRMGAALDRFAGELLRSVRAFRETGAELTASADDLVGRGEQLSAAAAEQASAVAESSATMAEIERTSRLTAENAVRIARAAGESAEVSGQGLGAVEEAVARYGEVRGRMAGVVTAVRRLSEELGEADQIVASVAEIAHQSQLLAINASIEAAKAGASGRGFAVVAREIRDLSVQSRAATERVRETLGRIGQGITGVAHSAASGEQATEAGAAGIEHAGQVIRGLGKVIGATAEAARMIEANVSQEVVGLEQMNRAVGGIAESSRLNLEEVRALGRVGDRLRAKAEDLERIVARFELPGDTGPAGEG